MIHLMYYIIDIKRVGSHRGPSELLTNDDCPLRFRTLLNVTRNLGSSRLRLRVDTTPWFCLLNLSVKEKIWIFFLLLLLYDSTPKHFWFTLLCFVYECYPVGPWETMRKIGSSVSPNSDSSVPVSASLTESGGGRFLFDSRSQYALVKTSLATQLVSSERKSCHLLSVF